MLVILINIFKLTAGLRLAQQVWRPETSRHPQEFFNKHHQLCKSKSCYCMFIVCTFACNFLNLPCLLVQVQETISVVLGLLCNHVPSVQLCQEVCHPESMHTTWYASPVAMLQLHEDQHYQELLRRRINSLGVLSRYLMVVTDTFWARISSCLVPSSV